MLAKTWRNTGTVRFSALHQRTRKNEAGLTNKDSIERSAPQLIGYNQDVIARSLDALRGWTSPGRLPCLLLFIPSGSNRLRRMAVRHNPGTEPSMAKVGWTVQSAFYGRNSHANRESSP